ncbi:MAG: hypothetical protein RSH24_20130 [Flavobacterium sp.]
MINKRLVQEIIEKEIGKDFEIFECFDTEPYIIIFWKNRNYDFDDERGQILGFGPIIFDKESEEYKLLGSGEWFYGDYYDFIDSKILEEEKRSDLILSDILSEKSIKDEDKYWLLNRIKSGIVRRKYVNFDDIDRLTVILGIRNDGVEFDFYRNYQNGGVVTLTCNNEIIVTEMKLIWEELGFSFEIISNCKLNLWQGKKLI